MALETDGNGGIIGPNQTLSAAPPTNPNLGGGSGLYTVAEVRRARLANTWPLFSQASIVATGGTENIYTTPAGTFKSHTFTGAGSFVVSSLNVPAPTATVEWFVVAGGGNAGAGIDFPPYSISQLGGSGGGGGYRTGTSPISAGTYPVSVGAAAANSTLALPTPITSTAGGAGGIGNGFAGTFAGSPGGSGGGGASGTPGGSQPGGTGNTPPTTPPQGNPGTTYTGGGAGAPGASGGAGVTINAINGTPFIVSGTGGSGSTYGGGGTGSYAPGPAGQAGVVIVRYPVQRGVQ